MTRAISFDLEIERIRISYIAPGERHALDE